MTKGDGGGVGGVLRYPTNTNTNTNTNLNTNTNTNTNTDKDDDEWFDKGRWWCVGGVLRCRGGVI